MHNLYPPPEDNLHHDDAPPVDSDHNGAVAPDELGRLQEMFDAASQSCRILGDDRGMPGVPPRPSEDRPLLEYRKQKRSCDRRALMSLSGAKRTTPPHGTA